MKKYIFLLISYSLFVFQSCDEDSFSQVVEIDIPVHEPLPALKLQMLAGQQELTAIVSNSKGVIDPDSIFKTPADAEVSLYRNGNLLTQLSFDDQYLHYSDLLTDEIPDIAGDEYLLEAKLVGYESVSATQIMPTKPIITDASYEVEGTIDSEGYRVDEIIVEVEDADPDNINYFGLNVFQIYYQIDVNGDTIDAYRSDMYLDTNDPLISYSNSYSLIFTDEAFSGGAFQVRAYTYNSIDENSGVEVELYQLTKDAFFFDRSLEQYYNAIDNPFAEPVTVHNNIEGGFGIFSLANKTIFKIR